MGHKVSSLKVYAKVTVVGGSGAVDAIRLSYRRSSCCGRRWKEIASFTFPRGGWSCEDVMRNISSNVATVPLGKLRNKDGDTPVKVTCLAGGISVFREVITISDLLHGLERTKQENKAILFFSLVCKVVEKETEAPTFTAMFCNGKRCGDDDAKHPTSRAMSPTLVEEDTKTDLRSSSSEINDLQPLQVMVGSDVSSVSEDISEGEFEADSLEVPTLPSIVPQNLVMEHSVTDVRSSVGGMSWFQPLHLTAASDVSSVSEDISEGEFEADSLEVPSLVPSTVPQNLVEEHTATDVYSSGGGIGWFQPLRLVKESGVSVPHKETTAKDITTMKHMPVCSFGKRQPLPREQAEWVRRQQEAQRQRANVRRLAGRRDSALPATTRGSVACRRSSRTGEL